MRSGRGLWCAVVGLCLVAGIGVGAAASATTDDLAVLLYGIVRLSGSSAALSAEQALALLPLVAAWRVELQSPPDEPPDMSGTIAAVRAILTPEQAAAIEAMNLNAADVVRWMDGGLAWSLWRGAMRAGRILQPTFLDAEAGRVQRILSGWASG